MVIQNVTDNDAICDWDNERDERDGNIDSSFIKMMVTSKTVMMPLIRML